MESDQASVFGFPNPMLGLVTYGIVDLRRHEPARPGPLPALVLAHLQRRHALRRRFCAWLMFQSLYRINALCLWCCLAWVATIIMFWYVTSFNVRNGFLPAPGG
ncbi:Integral membrane protein OS=Streptomyces glaucescens OX=1907 GN=SGLAU_06070 PE=3 SV=1 [Streptomyces glaucescens]